MSELLQAVYRGDEARVDELLSSDPELDVFEAAAVGRLDRLKDRLAAAPDAMTTFSPDGFTALHLAAFFGRAEAARILLEAGASVDTYTRNPFANQPLHAAAAGRQIEICRLLVAAGADVNATQHGGFTPLHEAAQHGDDEMVELFLSAGADPTIVVDDGRTAADLAEAEGHGDVAARLRDVAAQRGPGPSATAR
jgi:uncharacterized protein